MTLRSDLTTEIEKALRDIVYDGGNGAMTEVEFTRYVRSLAETAVEAVEELRDPAARTQLVTDARERLTTSRIGKSIMREMDADILIILRLVEALEALAPSGDDRVVTHSVGVSAVPAAGFRVSEPFIAPVAGVYEVSATGLRLVRAEVPPTDRNEAAQRWAARTPIGPESAPVQAFEAGWDARGRVQGEPSDAEVEAMRRALNAADIDYSAREQRADAGGGEMEPGDWLTFLAHAALRTAAVRGTGGEQ